MVSIRIRGLVKRFGDVVALDHLDLDIEAGELFFLLGPSGCGKTTLLRSIAGFHIPEAGEISFDKQDVTKVPPHKRETAMMFQSYALWPHLNVFKNVAFGLEERRVRKPEIKRRVEGALAMVKMQGLGNRKINELSGGQQQRVALARALVVRPRCLMLDEPLSNLDAKLRIEMRSEIRRICKDFGLTAIYVTHDQKEALSMADRMAILDGGKIAQIGTPVFKNVAFGLEERRVRKPEIKRRVEGALAMVKMQGLGNRKINELSGGQQQRVALARALVVRPRCLMLDEPLSNLDAKLRIEMRSEIRRICKDFGLTAIYVTHDQKEALSMADRMAILDGGKIAQIGTPEEVYRRPQTALVAGFVGETNLIPGTVQFESNDHLYVSTPLGDIVGQCSVPNWSPEPNEKVILSVRPECLSIHTTPPVQNAMKGYLKESIYLGETAQYSLLAEGLDELIHISELNPRRVIRETNEPFFATARPEDIVILPAP